VLGPRSPGRASCPSGVHARRRLPSSSRRTASTASRTRGRDRRRLRRDERVSPLWHPPVLCPGVGLPERQLHGRSLRAV